VKKFDAGDITKASNTGWVHSVGSSNYHLRFS
jgi:hypothetical protein